MNSRSWRRAALAAGTALLAAVSLTACETSGKKKTAKGSAKASAESQQPLKLGQPSPELQEISRWGKTGKFTITGQRVVMGKASDLTQLDANKYQGMTVAWVYVNAKLVEGDAPLKGPMVTSELSATSEGNQPGTKLILIGDLSSRPADCKEQDTDAIWQKGDDQTLCTPVIVPEKSKVTHITYRRGYYKEPLKWTVE
ncbi:hypothetical protein [Streptomyces sp. NPDC053048]|uniref:hypothetical protein n=1 Tax=Streptomyces sp. NPDC053048 TaxID=3365694 RepID=UPI0037D3DDE6